MAEKPESAGDPIPPGCELIEVRVGKLKQLFNALDPSPFQERDLDPMTEQFILEWASETKAATPLGLLVHLGRSSGARQESLLLRNAIHDSFKRRATSSRRQLRQLFHRGRISLAVGLVFLAFSIGTGEILANAMSGWRVAEILRQSLLIGGWVAMWRPLETFLYDWWPIRTEARQFDRLSGMAVRIKYDSADTSNAWQSDWPAVSPDGTTNRLQGGGA